MDAVLPSRLEMILGILVFVSPECPYCGKLAQAAGEVLGTAQRRDTVVICSGSFAEAKELLSVMTARVVVAIDTGDVVMKRYGIGSVPAVLLVDGEARLMGSAFGLSRSLVALTRLGG
jgi:thioredoxin family protein